MKPADQDLDTCIDHFTRANENRLSSIGTMRDVLAALPAIAPPDGSLPPNNSLEGFYYCWTHGVATHPGAACTHPAEGHVPIATLQNRSGGSQAVTLVRYKLAHQGQYRHPQTYQGGGRGRGRGRGRDTNRERNVKRKTQQDS
jgi:hypothetical protein